MSGTIFVNGTYRPHRGATIHVEDRALQFGDGVYEVVAAWKGGLVDWDDHVVRLHRSLGELSIDIPMADRPLRQVVDNVMRLNRVDSALVYLQVTRGTATRGHAFPDNVRPNLIVSARRWSGPPKGPIANGVAIATMPDLRWQRNDIKSTALLANVLVKQGANDAGAYEGWMVDAAGDITEGSSTNAWLVTSDGTLVTRAVTPEILSGVTRLATLRLADAAGLKVEQRCFSVGEAKSAPEVFLTSTSSGVLPVVTIDGATVADGKPGPTTRLLIDAYRAHLENSAE